MLVKKCIVAVNYLVVKIPIKRTHTDEIIATRRHEKGKINNPFF